MKLIDNDMRLAYSLSGFKLTDKFCGRFMRAALTFDLDMIAVAKNAEYISFFIRYKDIKEFLKAVGPKLAMKYESPYFLDGTEFVMCYSSPEDQVAGKYSKEAQEVTARQEKKWKSKQKKKNKKKRT